MIKYDKMEAVFERDMKHGRMLIWNKYRNPLVEYLKNNDWYFVEKVEGALQQIFWNGYELSLHGRSSRTNIMPVMQEYFNEHILTQSTKELFQQMFDKKEVSLFGYGYGGPILGKGRTYRDTPSFMLYDALVSNKYQSREVVESIAKILRVDLAPIVFTGSLVDGIQYMLNENKSPISTGIVDEVIARPKIEVRNFSSDRVILLMNHKEILESYDYYVLGKSVDNINSDSILQDNE